MMSAIDRLGRLVSLRFIAFGAAILSYFWFLAKRAKYVDWGIWFWADRIVLFIGLFIWAVFAGLGIVLLALGCGRTHFLRDICLSTLLGLALGVIVWKTISGVPGARSGTVISSNPAIHRTPLPIARRDTTAPTVAWVTPKQGDTVMSQYVYLEVTASEDDGGSGIQVVTILVRWDSAWCELAALRIPPYSYSWDLWRGGTGCVPVPPVGDIELEVQVIDIAGNRSKAEPRLHITKTVDCGMTSLLFPQPTKGWS